MALTSNEFDNLEVSDIRRIVLETMGAGQGKVAPGESNRRRRSSAPKSEDGPREAPESAQRKRLPLIVPLERKRGILNKAARRTGGLVRSGAGRLGIPIKGAGLAAGVILPFAILADMLRREIGDQENSIKALQDARGRDAFDIPAASDVGHSLMSGDLGGAFQKSTQLAIVGKNRVVGGLSAGWSYVRALLSLENTDKAAQDAKQAFWGNQIEPPPTVKIQLRDERRRLDRQFQFGAASVYSISKVESPIGG